MLAECIGFTELLEMAGQREIRQLQFKPSELPRLASLLGTSSVDETGGLQVRISFVSSAERFPEIGIAVNGSLMLECQSCMRPMHWDMDIEASLVVVERESELSEASDPFDCIVAGDNGVDLASVVEDEILASLPLSPMHPQGVDDCRATHRVTDSTVAKSGADGSEDSGFRTRPFADLASLMEQGDGKRHD